MQLLLSGRRKHHYTLKFTPVSFRKARSRYPLLYLEMVIDVHIYVHDVHIVANVRKLSQM
jgi:hypothetical protein